MKIKLTSAVAIKGEHQEAGTVLDMIDVDAWSLIARGRAVPFSDANEIDTNRAVGVAKSTSTTKKRTAKKKS